MEGQEEACVSVHNLSKKFSRSLKRSFVFGAQDIMRIAVGAPVSNDLRPTEFWALKDISLSLPRGSSLGLVGLNGSGKTTLLRTICGILRPTTGIVSIDGRIAPMIALGAGFKPVLSGRENVFLNMSLLGIAHSDIKHLFKQVVDFAELWESIDAPLGTYSTGMRMRLGFACAVHTDPQILVIDEVLSVGDTRFRVKCRNKINELRRGGTSMLLVSHSAVSVETLTDECIYLQSGRIAAVGNPVDVLRRYAEDTMQAAEEVNRAKMATLKTQHTVTAIPNQQTDNAPAKQGSDGSKAPAEADKAEVSATKVAETVAGQNDKITIQNLRVDRPGQTDAGHWIVGQPGSLSISLSIPKVFEDVSVNLMVFDTSAEAADVVQFINSYKDVGWHRMGPAMDEVEIHFDPVGLRPGIYRLKVSISQTEMHDIFDVVDGFRLVVRDGGLINSSAFFQPREWAIGGTVIDAIPPGSSGQEFLEDIDEGEF